MAEHLLSLFSAIDTVLSLHYSSNTAVPRLHDLCVRATRLTNKRVTTDTFEQLLAYDPKLYKVVSFGTDTYDYGIGIPDGVSVTKFSSLLPERKRHFQQLATHDVEPVPLALLAVPESRVLSPVKTSPKKSPTKVQKPAQMLRNSLAKFMFKEKTTGGGSLLERIKLKEKLQRAADEEATPQLKYDKHIGSKLLEVYDVLYELSSNTCTTYPLGKLISIVTDSFSYAISEEEVRDVIMELEKKLGSARIEILRRGPVCAVKVFPLDRTLDLALLQTS